MFGNHLQQGDVIWFETDFDHSYRKVVAFPPTMRLDRRLLIGLHLLIHFSNTCDIRPY